MPDSQPGSTRAGLRDPEATYYQTIEEFFVSRRGDPLMLSNADWLLIRKWRTSGMPLRVVLRGVADALESHARSWGRDRKVGSLAYCAREVEAARERWQRALGFGAEGEIDVGAVLLGFADDVARAHGLGPESARTAAELERELRRRAGEESLQDLEGWLGRQEAHLIETLRREDPREAMTAIDDEVDRSLAPYRDRMPARVLAQVRSDAVARRTLERHGIPRLSLFQVEPGESPRE
jgi:hypothetical protein